MRTPRETLLWGCGLFFGLMFGLLWSLHPELFIVPMILSIGCFILAQQKSFSDSAMRKEENHDSNARDS